jgi:2,4-dienoyl-CoA reductase-like NADH-dependent reductase (Old Yellow Enzyme family)
MAAVTLLRVYVLPSSSDSAVGGISSGTIANDIPKKGQADVVLVGRYFQQSPGLVWHFARELKV